MSGGVAVTVLITKTLWWTRIHEELAMMVMMMVIVMTTDINRTIHMSLSGSLRLAEEPWQFAPCVSISFDIESLELPPISHFPGQQILLHAFAPCKNDHGYNNKYHTNAVTLSNFLSFQTSFLSILKDIIEWLDGLVMTMLVKWIMLMLMMM